MQVYLAQALTIKVSQVGGQGQGQGVTAGHVTVGHFTKKKINCKVSFYKILLFFLLEKNIIKYEVYLECLEQKVVWQDR